MRKKLQALTAAMVVGLLGTGALVATGALVVTGVAGAAASPTVVTGGASSVSEKSAVLHGTVNPNGSSTTYYLQWGLTNAYGINGKLHSAGHGTKAIAVDEAASGLIPGTTYHYRVVASNQFGLSVGADRTFHTTGHPPPGVTTGPATGLSTTGATLTGVINPSGQATTYWFQWGNTPNYGEQTAAQTLAAGAAAESVSASLPPLAPGTFYDYRLVASHSGGGSATSFGANGTFLTYPSPAPTPGVTARTTPGLVRGAPFVLTTSGAVRGPSSIPSTYACTGNVTIRFFRGIRQVGFTLAGLQPNCTFSAQTTFARVPRRRHSHGPVHLRVVIRYVSNHYLASNRARYEHITVG